MSSIKFIPIVFGISLLLTGVFHEYLSCVFSIVLSGWLIYKIRKEKKPVFVKNTASIAIISICLFYGISCFWAVDSGMALIGFFKYLPVGLFLLCLMQERENADIIKQRLPYLAAVMAVVSLIGMYIPATAFEFNVAGRLAGFFEYPNTFALFLLVAQLQLLDKEKKQFYDYGILLVLIIGILFTGSRTAFVLAIVSNLMMAVLGKGKKAKVICLCGFLIAGLVLVFNQNLMNRFLQISTSESTFVGRWLYFQDALPLIIKKPLGLGFLGHYFMQPSIQTGVYSVRYIHNDWLQILLDIGWLPFLLLVAAVVKVMINKNNTYGKKVILAVMVLHSCFDFNLQFIAMFCLFVLYLDWKEGKTIVLKKVLVAAQTICVILVSFCIYIGAGLISMRTGNHELTYKLNPWNTENNIVLLTQREEISDMKELAEKITGQNEYVTIAYSALARCAYAEGDFASVIQCKNHIFEIAPFQYEEYEDYCYMLINGYSLYKETGDYDSAAICKEELKKTKQKLENIDGHLSEFGKQIKDQPMKELPEDIETYIMRLE